MEGHEAGLGVARPRCEFWIRKSHANAEEAADFRDWLPVGPDWVDACEGVGEEFLRFLKLAGVLNPSILDTWSDFGDDELLETLESLKAADLIKDDVKRVRVFLSGEIGRAVNVRGVTVTKGAKAAIEAAGGSVEA